MNTLDIINAALRAREITSRRALDILEKRFPAITWVLCEDTGEYADQDDCHQCEVSDDWYSTDEDFVTVTRSRRADVYCHKDHADSIGFYCERSRDWWHSDDYHAIEVEGETLCYEQYSDELYYWDSDGEYHWEEEEDESNGRSGYHSTSRLTTKAEGYGIELEIECRSDMPEFCDHARDAGLVPEEDASLNDTYGVELVGPVISFAKMQAWTGTPWDRIAAHYGAHDCRGHDAGTGYGLHVSVSLSLFSELTLSKFVLFLNSNPDLCRLVAQRDKIYSGSYGVQGKHKKFKKCQTGKYEAVKVDDVRAEVRIFRSNLRKERILKAVEFCEAARRFVGDCSAALVCQRDEATKPFLAWLDQRRKDFPNLAGFLIEMGRLKAPRSAPASVFKAAA